MRIVGHGIDLVEISRISQMLKEHGEKFLERCFTPEERVYNQDSKRYHEHLAARFAAKEAAMKALGTGLSEGLSWTDIQVVSEPNGRPTLDLHRAARDVAVRVGADEWWISLSHTDTHAIASVIAVRTGE
jgi:holo-[acyl-carrier protein] synthase